MWLESEKLPGFIEASSEFHSEESGNSEHDEHTGICPSGHGIMIRARIDIAEPFFLEKCSLCGGIWFDRGEWQKIVNSNFARNLNELWCRSWQARQRRDSSRQSYLESNKKLLGEGVYNEIMLLAQTLKDHPEKGRALALLQQEIFPASH
jgi:Zn-finger nucleic acid-binding protein